MFGLSSQESFATSFLGWRLMTLDLARQSVASWRSEELGIKEKNVGSIILKDKSFKSKSNNNGFLSRRKTYVDA
jgi:hypothetical protein